MFAKEQAEEVGFEPTMDCSIPVFKTGAFVHSAIPPERGYETSPRRDAFYHRVIMEAMFAGFP